MALNEVAMKAVRPLVVSLRDHGLVFVEQPPESHSARVMRLLLARTHGKPRGLRGIAGEWEFTP